MKNHYTNKVIFYLATEPNKKMNLSPMALYPGIYHLGPQLHFVLYMKPKTPGAETLAHCKSLSIITSYILKIFPRSQHI